MRRLVSFFHVSLDGFVAGPKGEMAWIKVDDEVFDHVSQRVGGTDTALYGRITWEMMEDYWPTAADQPDASKHDIEHAAWYKKAHKIVLSRSMQDRQQPDTTFIGADVAQRVKALKQQEGAELLIFGSPSATHTLMGYGLIDEYWLFINPVLLGQGIPLFKDVPGLTGLKFLGEKTFASGVICVGYERS